MTTFEYLVVYGFAEDLQPFLNTLGQTGWELIYVSPKREGHFIFKRKGVMPSTTPPASS